MEMTKLVNKTPLFVNKLIKIYIINYKINK